GYCFASLPVLDGKKGRVSPVLSPRRGFPQAPTRAAAMLARASGRQAGRLYGPRWKVPFGKLGNTTGCGICSAEQGSGRSTPALNTLRRKARLNVLPL